jgi:hypothetical protein
MFPKRPARRQRLTTVTPWGPLAAACGARPFARRTDRLVVVVCRAISTARGAACPRCGQSSTRAQSRYTRWVREVPWRQAPVRLALQVRRLVCRTPGCPRRIFAERLPRLPPYARRTTVFTTWVLQLGWAHSAETADALATTAGYPVSPGTLLRLLRRTPAPTPSTPRVLGVDDWALCSGGGKDLNRPLRGTDVAREGLFTRRDPGREPGPSGLAGSPEAGLFRQALFH